MHVAIQRASFEIDILEILVSEWWVVIHSQEQTHHFVQELKLASKFVVNVAERAFCNYGCSVLGQPSW